MPEMGAMSISRANIVALWCHVDCVLNIIVYVVLIFTGIIKSVVTGQAPVTLELTNTPGTKHKQTKRGTRTPGIS